MSPSGPASTAVVDGVDVHTTVDAWRVGVLPETHPEWSRFAVTVEYAGSGRWAVRNGGDQSFHSCIFSFDFLFSSSLCL